MLPLKTEDPINNPFKVREGLYIFPPDKACNNSASWWLDCFPEPLLIDCPSFNPTNIEALERLSRGRKPLIFLSSRDSHGKIKDLQEVLDWPVLVQEQEAYLLPTLKKLKTFAEQYITISGVRVLWTPGPTPGSSVAYAPSPWNVLFCGRLLIPTDFDRMSSLTNRKTFHATRQRNSLEKLRQWLPSDSSPALASGGELASYEAPKLMPWESWKEV